MNQREKALLLLIKLQCNLSKQLLLLLSLIPGLLVSEPYYLMDILIWDNQPHFRIPGFNDIDVWIDLYLDYDFFQLFRMSKETFGKLWTLIDGPDFVRIHQGGTAPPLKGHMQLLITLWWLGKGETLLSVSEKFNIVPSTVYTATKRVLTKILDLIHKFIYWPNTEDEFNSIVNGFQEIRGYPGVVGAIDGTNIKFKAPLEQQDNYIDKNDTHSIKLQVICTCQKIFTNIMAGFPGSAHDSRVFKNSEIYQEVLRGNKRKYFPTENYHLIGDKAYPLTDWLMKPYLGDDRHLTRQKRAHNLAHGQTRIRIEHSFGLLKGRWLILQCINVRTIEKAVKIITACCVLHNFCYFNGDTWNEELIDELIDDDEYNGGVADQMGMRKRDQISQLFR